MAARGGYRAGSGRSKSGYYNGIYCGSTYELCWVIHSLDHNISFTRFPNQLEQNGVKYYPDFLLSDGKTIIETKGYEKKESVDIKTKVAESHGYLVKVLRKDDLKYAFDYVSTAYSTKEFHTLYDGYKPKYNYVCNHCSSEFSRDKKLKTVEVFCSRVCTGKYRKLLRISSVTPIKMDRKFTKEQALEIYNRTDKSLQGLADEYNADKNSIWFIKKKKTYKWIHN
jgi:hypothetical protein